MDEDIDDDNDLDLLINFPPEVEKAIAEVLPSKDPLDAPNFNTVDYINSLFPNEQSLSNIDDVICKTEMKIHSIDDEINTVVRGQTDFHHDGRMALEQGQKVIRQLFVQVKDIKVKAEKSEEMVREITRDIKQLDTAKRNLTTAITTLNHLHMLVGGVESLKILTEKRLYSEILLPLQAVNEVMQHFQNYNDIPQIQVLSKQVNEIHIKLAEQIISDFQETFKSTNVKGMIQNKQLPDACHIVSILDPKVKRDLLKWYVNLQLEEYVHLFQDNQDTAWLDKIDKRYAWIKRHLLEFEDKFGSVFPTSWEVSECIAVEFCHRTREDLSKLMLKRKIDIDIKLLLFAIQRTQNFEILLSKRFTGVTLTVSDKINKGQPNKQTLEELPFKGLISQCFEPYFYIYVKSVDRNLFDLINRFVQDAKQSPLGRHSDSSFDEIGATILPSCADLFVFYKKCILQCVELGNVGQTMLDLTAVFKKYLREYAEKLLQNNLPKPISSSNTSNILSSAASSASGQAVSNAVSSITRDLQNLSTSGIIQNFSSLLKEGEDTKRFTKDDQIRICCILSTAEYCLETTEQLEKKLKEKIDDHLSDQISLVDEQDVFHNVISTCINILVQDLENACEPVLQSMVKMPWQNMDTVGDQSQYVTLIIAQLKYTVSLLRDNLTTSSKSSDSQRLLTETSDSYTASNRKYFTQFCTKFVNSFIVKFIQMLYKCKPISPIGAEQLLLDTHSLKTVLLDLPQIGSQVNRKAPTAYTKIVIEGMTKAEMILKVVMSSLESNKSFVEHFLKLLPGSQIAEFQKILEMKGLKRSEQLPIIELYKSLLADMQQNSDQNNLTSGIQVNNDLATNEISGSNDDSGRIRKLEKLIKMRIT